MCRRGNWYVSNTYRLTTVPLNKIAAFNIFTKDKHLKNSSIPIMRFFTYIYSFSTQFIFKVTYNWATYNWAGKTKAESCCSVTDLVFEPTMIFTQKHVPYILIQENTKVKKMSQNKHWSSLTAIHTLKAITKKNTKEHPPHLCLVSWLFSPILCYSIIRSSLCVSWCIFWYFLL